MVNREGVENSWTEYRRLVTQGLKDLDMDIKALDQKVMLQIDKINKHFNDMQLKMVVDITTLKTKASVWGGIVGFIVAAVVSVAVSILLRK